MKIVVYAICKNESAFVNRWMDSMSEADSVLVLDTGSSDDTVALLKQRGAQVHRQIIDPWRFDAARNRALELVPQDADICVCTDLDEVFAPGWRKALEQAWTPETTRGSYRYTWSFTDQGAEGVVFWIDKIHARHGYRWTHPVHEVLQWTNPGMPEVRLEIPGIQLNHYPDASKSRAQYLPLLELSVREDPDDDRNVHYLGREYLYLGRWDDCIAMLKRHLAMPSAAWPDERAASMRYIAKSHWMKGDRLLARSWYLTAIVEAPHLREPYMDLALMLYHDAQWDGVLYFTGCALAIENRPRSYICEADAWGSLPHDLRAIAYYHTDRPALALSEAEKALTKEPGNERLTQNVRFLKEKCSEK